jgi:integrase
MARKRQRPHGTGSLIKRTAGGSYLARWFAHDGRRLERSTGTTDKGAAERILANYITDSALRRKGIIDARADRYTQENRKPLTAHVDDWHAALIAKGGTAENADLVKVRVTRIIHGCGFKTIRDIRAHAVAEYLNGLHRDTEEHRGISLQTFNHYLTAIKGFCRWLVREGRAAENALAHLARQNVRTDRRHDRRALSSEEVSSLLTAARNGSERFGMTGPDRSMLYRLAVESGLRANELRSLSVGSFNLDGESPTVTVKAAYSKHRREDVQPIRPELASALKEHFTGKPADAPAFRLPAAWAVVDMIRADLDAAEISHHDDAGRVVDFHALRHTFITNLARGGIHPKIAQQLARHSTITLTMDRYSHTALSDLHDALATLPDLQAVQTAAVKEATNDTPTSNPTSCDAKTSKRNAAPCDEKATARLTGGSRKPLNVGKVSGGVRSSTTKCVNAPGAIRTRDLRFRKPLLYPAELRAQHLWQCLGCGSCQCVLTTRCIILSRDDLSMLS